MRSRTSLVASSIIIYLQFLLFFSTAGTTEAFTGESNVSLLKRLGNRFLLKANDFTDQWLVDLIKACSGWMCCSSSWVRKLNQPTEMSLFQAELLKVKFLVWSCVARLHQLQKKVTTSTERQKDRCISVIYQNIFRTKYKRQQKIISNKYNGEIF